MTVEYGNYLGFCSCPLLILILGVEIPFVSFVPQIFSGWHAEKEEALGEKKKSRGGLGGGGGELSGACSDICNSKQSRGSNVGTGLNDATFFLWYNVIVDLLE